MVFPHAAPPQHAAELGNKGKGGGGSVFSLPDVRVGKAGRRRRGGIRFPETASVEKLEGAEE